MAAKITVRELITKLTIGGNAGDKLARFGLQVNGIKAALDIMVGAIRIASRATLGLVDDVTQAGDAVAKTSREIGISAKSLQRLTFAAERSGAPLQNLKKGLQNIERNLRDATIAVGKGKGTGFTAALAEVGIRLREFEGLSPEEKLGLIGEALAQVANEGRRVALSQKLVGEEAGPKLASLLSEGTSGIKALGDEAERLGLVMDDKALAASEAFQDSMTNLKSVVKGVKTSIGISLLPIVKRVIDLTKSWTLENGKFVKQKFSKAIEALSKVVDFLIKNSEKLLDQFGNLAVMSAKLVEFFLDLSESVGGLDNLVRLLTAAWVTYRIAAIAATTGLALGPLGLLAVGLLAVGAAFSDVETKADRARIARDKFNAGLKEDEPIDKAQASRDAKAIAKASREGKELSPALKARLISQSSRQTKISFDAARVFVKQGVKGQRGLARQVGRRISGKSGISVATRKPVDVGKGQLGLLREIELRIVDLRGEAASDLKFLEDAFAFNEGLASGAGGGGGGRSFKTFKEGTGEDKKDNLSDLLAEAIKSGELPESAALLASTQPPIIIPITNINVQMDVDASMAFEGIAGEDDGSLIERFREVATDVLGTEFRSAMDELRPQLSR